MNDLADIESMLDNPLVMISGFSLNEEEPSGGTGSKSKTPMTKL